MNDEWCTEINPVAGQINVSSGFGSLKNYVQWLCFWCNIFLSFDVSIIFCSTKVCWILVNLIIFEKFYKQITLTNLIYVALVRYIKNASVWVCIYESIYFPIV